MPYLRTNYGNQLSNTFSLNYDKLTHPILAHSTTVNHQSNTCPFDYHKPIQYLLARLNHPFNTPPNKPSRIPITSSDYGNHTNTCSLIHRVSKLATRQSQSYSLDQPNYSLKQPVHINLMRTRPKQPHISTYRKRISRNHTYPLIGTRLKLPYL